MSDQLLQDDKIVLPKKFVQFLKENDIPIEIYNQNIDTLVPRYIRLNPRSTLIQQQDMPMELFLKEKIQQQQQVYPQRNLEGTNVGLKSDVQVSRVDWLQDDFYALTPSSINIANTDLYKNGDIYGADAASGAAVEALLLDLGKLPKNLQFNKKNSCSSNNFKGVTGKRNINSVLVNNDNNADHNNNNNVDSCIDSVGVEIITDDQKQNEQKLFDSLQYCNDAELQVLIKDGQGQIYLDDNQNFQQEKQKFDNLSGSPTRKKIEQNQLNEVTLPQNIATENSQLEKFDISPQKIINFSFVPSNIQHNNLQNQQQRVVDDEKQIQEISQGQTFEINDNQKNSGINYDYKIYVLDLCCAPGTKFCHLADRLISSGRSFSLVGVDNSPSRIAACDTVVAKYFPENKQFDIQLVESDGTMFFMDQSHNFENNICGSKKRRKICRTGKQKAGKNKFIQGQTSSLENKTDEEEIKSHTETTKHGCFDYVLVDAECSHDGSIKHIQKYQTQWGMETLETRIPWIQNQDQLCELQLKLLQNGFRNLKVGGSLVYSTCSFCRSQNEDIVEKFLESQKGNAKKISLDFKNAPPCKFTDEEKSMARFDPVVSLTSGLFIAKVTKLREKQIDIKQQ